MRYPVSVSCQRWDKSRRKLKKYGLKWDGEKWFGKVKASRYALFESFCRNKHLKYCIDNGFGERNSSYRHDFFSSHPPQVLGKYYFCAYCGRLLSKKNVTVDHLWSVDLAKKNPKVQKKLGRKGYSNVNDVRNLLPACSDCNGKKGKKAGWWIIRGRIGRHKIFWYLIYLLRFAACMCVIKYLYDAGFFNTMFSL